MFPAILVGFGVTTLLRRGLRVAAFYAIPLGSIYVAWYVTYGRDTSSPLQLTGRALRFAALMFWATFDALAQGGIGTVLVAGAAIGLGAAVRRARRSGAWDDAALPLGLAVAWMTFAALTALARANIELTAESWNSGRYLDIGSALLLPLVGAGAEVLARRRMLLGAAVLVPLAVGLPGNIDKFAHTEPIFRGNRQQLLAIAHSPFADEVPPDSTLNVVGPFESPMTIGWLVRQADAGRIPEPDGHDPVRDLNAASLLVLHQEGGSSGDQRGCPPLGTALTLTLQSGDEIQFSGAINVSATDGSHESSALPFLSRDGSVIRAQAGPVDVVVRPAMGEPSGVCPPRAAEG